MSQRWRDRPFERSSRGQTVDRTAEPRRPGLGSRNPPVTAPNSQFDPLNRTVTGADHIGSAFENDLSNPYAVDRWRDQPFERSAASRREPSRTTSRLNRTISGDDRVDPALEEDLYAPTGTRWRDRPIERSIGRAPDPRNNLPGGARQSGYRGLDRAMDRIDRNRDRFEDRTGRVNPGLDNAFDRTTRNMDRFEERSDDRFDD
jgi:hypothetical protein